MIFGYKLNTNRMLNCMAFLVFICFLWVINPGMASAEQTILTLSSSSYIPGGNITASGTSDASTMISIKVVDSLENIVFYDAVKSDADGNYSDTFKVPSVASGTLTVVAGYGPNVATQSLTVQTSVGGGGGGGSSLPVTSNAVITVGQGNEAVVEIPAGVLSDTEKLAVKVEKVAAPPTAPAESRLASDVYEFSVGGKSTYNFTKNVIISLKFNAENIGPGELAAVYYYDEATQEWVNIGGTVSGNIITVQINHFTKFAVMLVKPVEVKPEVVLSDIAGNWAETNIKQMVALGAISGYPDGSFKPTNNITRAEFTTVLVKAFKLEAQSSKVYTDTASHWAKNYIATATANNIVNGYTDTSFGPDEFITREQMAVMIVNAAKLTKVTGGKVFTDNAQISTWAQDAIATASSNSLITGYPDNSFKPQNNATRAEAASVIAKAL